MLIFSGGNVVTYDSILEGYSVIVENGVITRIVKAPGVKNAEACLVDSRDLYICPGFIDIHTHGVLSWSYSDAEHIPEMLAALPGFGVTGCLPTAGSMDRKLYEPWLDAVHKIMEQNCPGTRLIGAHLEGPYINKESRGGMSEDTVRVPDPDDYKLLLDRHKDVVRMMTLSPELPGALELIRSLRKRGIVATGGHSIASPSEIYAALEAGLQNVCHTFDSTPGWFLVKEPGVRRPCIDEIGLLEDSLATEIIADGIHVDSVYMKLLRKCKPPDKIILITDSVPGAGLPEGSYNLPDGRPFRISKDDAARLISDGALVGSSLTMDRAVRTFIRLAGATLLEAMRAASSNPAKLLGIDRLTGAIEPGKCADIVLLDRQLNVRETYIRGICAYKTNTK